MRQCSSCGRFLPGYEQLCRQCYAAQYAALTAPKGSFWHRFRRSLAYITDLRYAPDDPEELEANTDLSNYGWSAYMHLLFWLLCEALVGAFFCAFFTYMPDFAKAILGMAALAIIWYDRLFPKRTIKSYATPLFGLPMIFNLFCVVAWEITHEYVWSTLVCAGICVTAVYIVIGRRPYD
jgi:hypothetical protein